MSCRQYTRLFRSLRAGNVVLRNRVVMGSMHTGLEDFAAWRGLGRLAAFYRERARHGVGLIVTGGFAPNNVGRLAPWSSKLTSRREVHAHRAVTDAVHAEGGKIALQILHAGRYAHHPLAVAPSALRAPIARFTPRALSTTGVATTVDDFVRCAERAAEAGYDGVEVMGSEGYLINQFLNAHTNRRSDEWGGASLTNRLQLPTRIVSGVRRACGDNFLLLYRISVADLLPDDCSASWEEIEAVAQAVVAAGADVLGTGIGWHESRVPTIAGVVPRAGFAHVAERLRQCVDGVPVVASNRINTPEAAERVLARGQADLVSLARPLLADPAFVSKARDARADEINTCIACNQSCLDRVFSGKRASCMVNPLACYETERVVAPARTPRRIVVVGGGVAGMACALTAAQRGHRVTLLERGRHLGGQFRFAAQVPGKEDFAETLRYYRVMLLKHGVDVRLECVDALLKPRLLASTFDDIVLATGVSPRRLGDTLVREPDSPVRILSYADVLRPRGPGSQKNSNGDNDAQHYGRRIAILGAGGIGFDVAEFLTAPVIAATLPSWLEWWCSGQEGRPIATSTSLHLSRNAKVYLLQRKTGKHGADLGTTTGWIRRLALRYRAVDMIGGVASYDRVTSDGHLVVRMRDENVERRLRVDTVVECIGQERASADLESRLRVLGASVHVVGGAAEPSALDAERAIRQGTTIACDL